MVGHQICGQEPEPFEIDFLPESAGAVGDICYDIAVSQVEPGDGGYQLIVRSERDRGDRDGTTVA
jgi:hypothetical protein